MRYVSAPLNHVPCQSNCVVAIYSEIKNLIKSNSQNKLKLGVERLVWGCPGGGGVFMGVVML